MIKQWIFYLSKKVNKYESLDSLFDKVRDKKQRDTDDDLWKYKQLIRLFNTTNSTNIA